MRIGGSYAIKKEQENNESFHNTITSTGFKDMMLKTRERERERERERGRKRERERERERREA